MLNQLQASDFLPYLHQTFHLYPTETAAIAANLIEVSEWGPEPTQPDQRRPFALVFRVALSLVLPQQIYPIAHDQLGTVEIFLVPIGPDAEGMQYQAIFG